jgi:hypothetical protein
LLCWNSCSYTCKPMHFLNQVYQCGYFFMQHSSVNCITMPLLWEDFLPSLYHRKFKTIISPLLKGFYLFLSPQQVPFQ